MTKPLDSPLYDPADLLAIRAARADLYTAQAERRRVMLLTGRWQLQLTRDPGPVQSARQDLDAARAAARNAGQPKGADDANL